MRDHEYKRHGTLTLMAGIDLLAGRVHTLVKERHRSRECLARDHELARAQPNGRFTFTFTPAHGSWLNLIEGFFSKLARSLLRHIRVSPKHELKERLMAFIDDINREPVVHTWRYKIDNAA
jgi:transposase